MCAQVTLQIAHSADMERLGAVLASAGRRGQRVYLHGPLAAGKTTLARGYVHALGYAGAVKSPTFTLVESYAGGAASIHHFDLYRTGAAGELEFIGIDDYLDGGADILVEWAERGAGVLPDATFALDIAVHGSGRAVTVSGPKAMLDAIVREFNKNVN